MPQRCITTARAIMSLFLQAWPQASPPFRMVRGSIATTPFRVVCGPTTMTPLATTIHPSLAAKRHCQFKTNAGDCHLFGFVPQFVFLFGGDALAVGLSSLLAVIWHLIPPSIAVCGSNCGLP